ncbi:MAG: CBS domain-containing protein [Candidatus Bathyarchaeota archaeon]|jgi:CBS domain-containing protein|nr:CBS domain-containing protein [Candidatus Bathyarchaeota archaeon]MDH5664174.1 CBS domain-containing protein [Candidatus Bathyarchaeota archaeon]
MDVKDVMVKEIITVNPTTKIRDAVELMNKNQIGCLVVTRKGKPVGIMTERDVLKQIVCRCKNPEQTRVSEIMSKPLIVGRVDMDWLEAVKLMLDRNIKKLPILDDERLVGLVTLTDIARMRMLQALEIDTLTFGILSRHKQSPG